MKSYRFLRAHVGLWLFVGAACLQAQDKVDFAHDVLPVLRRECGACHGAAQQQGGLRLDRKSSVMKAFSRRVVPGSSANSLLYHRLIGNEYGKQMPPTGALKAEQVAVIKAWIDQGATWPDALANEAELPPVNPKAMAMVESLRNGDSAGFLKAAAADPALLNARGPEGSTPFMYSVLYSNAGLVAKLLKLGGDPKKRNDANATALMWAGRDREKYALLLERGADVNAKSDDFRTPLMIAARRPGAAAIVKLLLDHGANPNPNQHPENESSPLIEAATGGDGAIVEMLMERGADAKAAGQAALSIAIAEKCWKCADLIAAKITDKAVFTGSLQDVAVYGDIKMVRLLLDRGADVNAFDPTGRTALMYAAVSDLLPVDVVKLLIERGADVNAKNRHAKAGDTGLTVLDIAKLNGDTPVTRLLAEAGAKTGAAPLPALKMRRDNSIQSAVRDSLPLLQRADANFVQGSGCVSCHNDSLAAMTVGLARKRGFSIDEKTAAAQVRANVMALEKLRDRLHQGFMIPVGDNFSEGVLAYMLLGLDAENYKADINTDAAAMHILMRQAADGQWPSPNADTRPPLCLNFIGQTALSMRALQLYAPKVGAAYERSIRLAAEWIAKAQPLNNDDRGWKVAGLAWAGTYPAEMKKAVQELLATQREDGGWSDLPSMNSSAYATGKSLFALQLGGVPVSGAAYQRGVRFLLNTQLADGSWFVKTRALAFQPYFDAGFPHEYDQWISAAGSNWAAMALALALPEKGVLKAFRIP